MALHLSDIKTSLRAFTTFSSTSTTPNANSRLFNERLQNRDANHGARLHDEPAKRPTLHLVTLQEHRRLGGAAESRNIPSSVACMSNSACRTVSNSAYNTHLLRVRLREQVTWVAYDSRENGVFQRHAQLGDITRPRPVAAQLLYARCRSSATAEQALSPHRRGQVQDAPKCARVRVIVVAAAAGAVLLRPVPWSDAALRQP